MVVALLTTALLIVNLHPEIWKGLLEERNLTRIAIGVSLMAIIVLLAIGGAASTIPSTAATITVVPSPTPEAPTPTATIDSPRAMITTRPWRSAKCPAWTLKPETLRTKATP